jgi:hypothetical protein
MRAEKKSSAVNSDIEMEASDGSVQHLPPDSSQRYEGIAFSSSGNIIAAASSITNAVFLYRRKPDGRFEDTPIARSKDPLQNLSIRTMSHLRRRAKPKCSRSLNAAVRSLSMKKIRQPTIIGQIRFLKSPARRRN